MSRTNLLKNFFFCGIKQLGQKGFLESEQPVKFDSLSNIEIKIRWLANLTVNQLFGEIIKFRLRIPLRVIGLN